MEWETTLEQATVLEKIAEDTLVFLQLHKRVWPSAQRDALFWSHSRCVKSENHSQTWIVCNQVCIYIVHIEPSVPGTIRHILVVVANSISYTQTYYTVRHSKNAKFQEFNDF